MNRFNFSVFGFSGFSIPWTLVACKTYTCSWLKCGEGTALRTCEAKARVPIDCRPMIPPLRVLHSAFWIPFQFHCICWYAPHTSKETFCIKDTAERGITREQLAKIVVFISKMADRWCETFGEQRGTRLQFETFNLYHANHWIIKPATEAWICWWCDNIFQFEESTLCLFLIGPIMQNPRTAMRKGAAAWLRSWRFKCRDLTGLCHMLGLSLG